eukprot:CAMPEP_0202062774 /NCGR_PEP_ID=MMETSP0963-20130614/44746_1 /ASSEMBLY_ACC=CAM_ASM_000494 /TAXON_ID=4773 /ORGANISM="Schizochytrium aggregatum, Strain ATCC28209" /LENGTH=37 /DNA_ID= /DNA_START= /DNA_END= /DNA_ORIENTATION=
MPNMLSMLVKRSALRSRRQLSGHKTTSVSTSTEVARA